jgi:hypothetical protein
VVIGAPDVDDALEAALELVHVIGDVGGEVGGLAVLADHDAVLLVAEGGGAEPERAGLLVEVAGLAQALDGAVDGAALGQRALRVPLLIVTPNSPRSSRMSSRMVFSPSSKTKR